MARAEAGPGVVPTRENLVPSFMTTERPSRRGVAEIESGAR